MNRSRWKRLLHCSSCVFKNGQSNYPLPWPYLEERPIGINGGILNRSAGIYLLKSVTKTIGTDFKTSSFLIGVKDAIYCVSDLLGSPNRELQCSLEAILDRELYQAVRSSLDSVADCRVHLDVESIRQLQLVTVNSIAGAAVPDRDQHEICWLGQTVVTSQAEMERVFEDSGKITVKTAREVAESAMLSHMEFGLTVTFLTKEKFAIMDREGRIIQGSNKFQNAYHAWRFRSRVNWDGDYPFQWEVADINCFLMNRELPVQGQS